jgi:uncharacterized protein YjbI with pentapeptide repeats
MSGANLAGALMLGADLTGADLSNSKLNGVVFVGANLNGVNLKGADLTGAILDLPLPPDATSDFDYQTLTGNDLLNAILQTPIAKVVFDPLIRELTELNLKTLLKDAQLQGVIYDDSTLWPLGFAVPDTAIKSP